MVRFGAVRNGRRKEIQRLKCPIIGVGIIVAALATAGHHLPFEPTTGQKGARVPLSASLRIDGPFDPSHAGEMVAARAGLFDREGLHIALEAGNANALDSVHSVSVGIDTFGSASAENFLVGRSEGARLVAFAGVYLESPVVFYVLEKSGIRTPNDFVGKRVGYQPGQDTALIYQALMTKLLLPRSQVHELRVSSDDMLLLTGAVDVWPGHVGADAYAFTQEGVGYNFLAPADYGIHVPGTVYFTTERVIREQPGLVRRFIRAVIGGWELTYAEEATSIPQIASYDPTVLTPQLIRFRLKQQRDFLRPFGVRFGEFDDTHWRSLQDILVQQRLIKEPINLSSAVTFDFLRETYRRSGALGP